MREVVAAIWILLHLLLEKSASQDLAPSVGRMARSEYAACASAGRMPNSEAAACETYYLCAVNTDGTLTVALAYCPLSTVFSPEKLQCVSASTYACPNASPDVATSAVTSLPADEPEPFQCTEVGRFPNPASADCKLYYLCSRDQNGIMASYLAQCPGETVFDAKQGACVASAPGVCPSAPTPPPEETTTTVAQFVCPGAGRFPNEQSMDCKLYYLCSKDQNGNMVLYSAQCPGETVFDAKQGSCVASAPGVCPSAPTPPPEETTTTVAQFVCPGAGRFPNEQSMDCKLYYLCSKDQNGNMVLYSAQCPLTTVFNPAELKCVPPESYTCPRATTEPTVTDTPAPTTVDPPTTEAVTPSETPTPTEVEFSSTTGSVTEVTDEETMEPTVTDTPAPTTVDPPTTEAVTPSETPTPTEVEFSSTTGSVTEVTDEETMEPTVTETPAPTTVDPPTTEAVTPSETPTPTEVEFSSTTGSVTEVTDTPAPTTEAATSSEATSAATTTDWVDGTTEVPTASTDAPTDSSSAAETTPTSPLPTDETTTDAIDGPSTVLAPFVCPAMGRFADPDASACESYLLCMENSIGTLTAVQLPCPQSTIFSEALGSCAPASKYSCGRDRTTESGVDVTSTTATNMPTTIPVTSQPIIPTPEPFVCPSDGRHANPGSIYCKSYYLCLRDMSNRLYPIELSCPMESIFHAAELRCVPADQHTCILSEATTTTPTTTTTTLPTTPEPFVCPSDGRHAKPGSDNGNSYYLCLRDTSNRLFPIELSCPMDSIFLKAELRCVPAAEQTRILPVTTVTTATSAPTTTERPACVAQGKLPAPYQIPNCQSYIYCLRAATGDFVQYSFRCPQGTLFDEEKRVCSASYVCPR